MPLTATPLSLKFAIICIPALVCACAPTTAQDLAKVNRSVVNRAIKADEKLRQGHELLVFGSVPAVVRARDALARVLRANEPDLRSIDGQSKRDKSFVYFREADVKLEVVVADRPSARASATQSIFISQAILDDDFPFAAKTAGALIGVIAHEVAHLREAHTLIHTLALQAQARDKRENAGVPVFNWFRKGMIVFVPVAIVAAAIAGEWDRIADFESEEYFELIEDGPMDNEPPNPRLREFGRLMEYAADLAALELVQAAGADPREYVEYLSRLSDYHVSNETTGTLVAGNQALTPLVSEPVTGAGQTGRELRNRARCLGKAIEVSDLASSYLSLPQCAGASAGGPALPGSVQSALRVGPAAALEPRMIDEVVQWLSRPMDQVLQQVR